MTDNNSVKLAFGIMKGLTIGVGFLLLWQISGVHLGFWGILIFAGIVLFPILQSKTSTSLTAKIPSWKTAAGWVIVLVIVGALVFGVIQIGTELHQMKTGGLVVSNPSMENQLDGWDGDEGAKTRGKCFILSRKGSSLTREFTGGTIATVALVNIELLEGEKGEIEILIEDLYDYSSDPENFLGGVYKRNARFTFNVMEEKITSSNEVEFGNSMKKEKLKWSKNETIEKQDGNFISVAIEEKQIGTYYGGKGNFSSHLWQICPAGYWSRDIKRPYRITIKNLSDNEILIVGIPIRFEPI